MRLARLLAVCLALNGAIAVTRPILSRNNRAINLRAHHNGHIVLDLHRRSALPVFGEGWAGVIPALVKGGAKLPKLASKWKDKFSRNPPSSSAPVPRDPWRKFRLEKVPEGVDDPNLGTVPSRRRRNKYWNEHPRFSALREVAQKQKRQRNKAQAEAEAEAEASSSGASSSGSSEIV